MQCNAMQCNAMLHKTLNLAAQGKDGNDNGVIYIIAGDVLEANYIDADDSLGNTDVLKQARGTVAAYDPEVAESSVRGGWCAYDPNGRLDPVLPAMLFVSLAFTGLRRREDDTV
jgi:hypothetical protein